jgi:hypothetical protein
MKKTLKLGMLAFAMLFATSLVAQPPTPNTNGSAPTSSNSINRSHNTEPVGTATLLMLGMGGAFLGYKVKKSKKENKD